jgi:hypothetical protein
MDAGKTVTFSIPTPPPYDGKGVGPSVAERQVGSQQKRATEGNLGNPQSGFLAERSVRSE